MTDFRKSYDFVGALAFLALGFYGTAESLGIHRLSGEIFYVSPGFVPFLLSAVLVLCAVLLLGQSLRDGGPRTRAAEFGRRLADLRGPNARATAGGIALLFVYSCVLLRILSFRLSSFLFLVALMGFLRATSVVRVLLVSAVSVGAIVVFFEIGFHVPLP